MKKLTYEEMAEGLHYLTRDELHNLNKALIVIARSKGRENRLEKAAEVVTKFRVGDVIKFEKSGRGRHAGTHYFRYENLNRNMDCMQGKECDEHGKELPLACKWTVGLTQPSVEVHMRDGKPFKAAA